MLLTQHQLLNNLKNGELKNFFNNITFHMEEKEKLSFNI